ncbi:phosphotransferase [Flavobacterium anhuiense]|uniref:phosphotransferase n=1 Tax=Flavobacterium anhuiense TaxID=459526 RepID=UPI003D9925E5
MKQEFSVINSTLSANKLCEVVQNKYNLGQNTDCKLFRAAMNHLYVVADGVEKYVFRVYTHDWRTKVEIEEELRLLLHLKRSNTSIAYPIADISDELVQEFDAPEGKRYGVLFSYAKGVKIAKFSADASFIIGKGLAKVHKASENFTLKRINYNEQTLLDESLIRVKLFFKDTSDEIQFLESLSRFLKTKFKNVNKEEIRSGAVHLDVWFDNMHIDQDKEATFFDFDFCGNGWLCLDISYFLYQLFLTNLNENDYLIKAEQFLKGYESETAISEEEKKVLPYLCLAIMIYYISIQCDRFDYWTNIFLNEDHLKRFVTNLKRWLTHNKIELI